MTRYWSRDERMYWAAPGDRTPARLGVSSAPARDAAIERSGWTVPGMLLARSLLTPDDIALCQISQASPAGGEWLGTTWSAYREAVAALSGGFARLGLLAGERVGIMAPSCREWDFAQLGILAAGGVAVGLDPHGLDQHVREIARRCQFAGLVLAHPAQLDKLDEQTRQALRFVVCLDAAAAAGVVPLAELLAETSTSDDWNRAQADAPATIIFTSGTTGEPKGIEYSHRQICLAAAAILAAYPEVAEGSRLACWLPLSNLFQRMINLSAIGRGAQTYYVADPRQVMLYVKSIEPSLFIGVPRFFEKLHAGIEEVLSQQPRWQQRLVRWALQVGDRRAAAERAGQRPVIGLRLQFIAANWLALGKLRSVLGSELRFMISGSAPMPVWLLERFHAMGLPILEAYGISENIIPVSLNRPDCFRFGTVGKVLPGSEVRLAEDGELLVRGAGVFAGYLGDDKGAVPDPLDAAGYLASGDYASIDADGFITLVGRKSDIFKTSTGRRISPVSVESVLQQVSGIDHVLVFGARRPQPVALLVLTEAAWQAGRQESFTRLRAQLAAASGVLPAYQRPAGLLITAQALTIEGGELTANLKLRRQVIEAKKAAALSALFARIDGAPGASFEAWAEDNRAFYCSP